MERRNGQIESVFCLCARYATSCPQPSRWRNHCIKGPLQLGHSKIANRHHICTQRTVCCDPAKRAISSQRIRLIFAYLPNHNPFCFSLCRMQPFIYHSHKRLSIAREEIASSTPRRLDPNPLAPSTLYPSNFFCFSLPSHFLSESPLRKSEYVFGDEQSKSALCTALFPSTCTCEYV